MFLYVKSERRQTIKPTQILLISFIIIICVGTALLMLPGMSTTPIHFIDALFTSTSAVCVTGLTTVDISNNFTVAGQIIIAILIQIGGLGIMTLSTFFMFLIMGRFSIFDAEIIQATLTQKPIKNLANFLKLIFCFTFIVEIVGAVLLSLRFVFYMPLKQALYYGFFHSVSAFCNAGFSLFSTSFMAYQGDIFINIILMGLIIVGGLGFMVVLDLARYIRCLWAGTRFQLSVHSKIVISISTVLIFSGALIFFLLEMHNALAGVPFLSKWMAAFFQSVTARTAGFNTIDIANLSNTTLFLLVLLMFIGASPGSCGGGIKTSTFGILIAFLLAKFQNQIDINIFKRRVPGDIIARTISITFFSILVITLFTLMLSYSELGDLSHHDSRGMFLEVLFEVVSAFGTVGLSTGITSSLSSIGKVFIILLMYIGRLGPLTIALAIVAKEPLRYKYPKENVLVG